MGGLLQQVCPRLEICLLWHSAFFQTLRIVMKSIRFQHTVAAHGSLWTVPIKNTVAQKPPVLSMEFNEVLYGFLWMLLFENRDQVRHIDIHFHQHYYYIAL